MTTPAQKLIAIFGNQNNASIEISKVRHCARQQVNRWVKDNYIPHSWGVTLERATDGKITASEVWIAAAKYRKH